MRRLSLLPGIASAACVIAISSSACAQAPRAFDIPAGSLRDGLNQFATQSDQQLFYSGGLVAGLRTPGLRGRYAPSSALDLLLEGSGVTWSETRPGVIFLRPSVGMAEAEATVDEIVVTGSLLKASGELASPVLVLDRDALDRRGLGTVADILQDLPQNYGGAGNPAASLSGADRGGSNSVFATGVNLRGLGPDATLVLVNGRRLAGTGFRGEFADVSALPSSAVERVDVLLDGASALYGSDAVAGVVNVIMRRAFDGQESRLRLGAARGGAEDVIVSHLGGRSWASGSALMSYEYQHINALSSLDRSYTADGDLRPFGGTDRRVPFSSPGNIVTFNAATGAYISQWAIRPDATGTARAPGDFELGGANLQAAALGQDLSPEVERHSVYGRVRQGIGERLDLSADLRFSMRDYSFDGAATATVFSVGRANPFFVSPSGAASHILGYSFYGDLGSPQRSGSSRSLGVTTGGSYDLGRDWSADGYVAYALERGLVETLGRLNTRFLTEALGNIPDDPQTSYRAAVDGYFNPFGGGGANGRAVLDFISSGYTRARDRSDAGSVNLLLSGPLISLPGGQIQAAVGLQHRREGFETQTDSLGTTATPVLTAVPEQSRQISAVFSEIRIPIVGEDNVRPGIRSLEVSLAGRVERYDDFGTTTNPKLGVVWSPVDDLSIRASWGTSFRAPGLPQINDASAASAVFVPRADGARILGIYVYGGNRDLAPETAETFTVGFDYRRADFGSFSVSLFDTEFSDRIAQPTAANITGALTDSSLQPFVTLVNPATSAADLALVNSYVTRADFPNGTLFPATTFGAILDGRWVNTGAVRVRGLDVSGRYPLLKGRDTLSLDASASYLFDYEVQTTPAAPVRDVLDQVGYPTRLRSRVGVVWSRGVLGLAAHWSHVSAYEAPTGDQIEDWDTVDVRASLSPETGPLSGLQLALSVQNLFDADPPFYDSPSGYGFDAAQASLLGRSVALQLIKRW